LNDYRFNCRHTAQLIQLRLELEDIKWSHNLLAEIDDNVRLQKPR